MLVCLQNHIPTFSSIAPIWASSGNETFSPKAETTISAVAPFHADSRFIDELHLLS